MLAALLAGCGAAEWRDADARLTAAVAAARGQGYAPLAGPHNAFLAFNASGARVMTVQLRKGRPYLVAAACTAGCTTLDFDVTGPGNRTVGADTSAGTTPRLAFTAPVAGPYRISITWGTCRAASCRWVAQVYTR
jgi:hypothetical protein